MPAPRTTDGEAAAAWLHGGLAPLARPVLASREGCGAGELVPETGALVNPRDPAALGAVLERAVSGR